MSKKQIGTADVFMCYDASTVVKVPVCTGDTQEDIISRADGECSINNVEINDPKLDFCQVNKLDIEPRAFSYRILDPETSCYGEEVEEKAVFLSSKEFARSIAEREFWLQQNGSFGIHGCISIQVCADDEAEFEGFTFCYELNFTELSE